MTTLRDLKKGKKRYRILLAALCGLTLASCTQDYLEGGGRGGDPLAPGTVSLSVRIPGLTPGPEALAGVDEWGIDPDALHVLLFRSEGGDWVYDGKYFGPDDITQAGTPTVSGGSTLVQFRFSLPPGESTEGKTYRAMLLANTKTRRSDVVTDAVPGIDEGMPIAEVRKLLVFELTAMTGTHIPMWGETEVAFTAAHTSAGQVRMLRSMARIDVGLNFRKGPDGSYDLNDMTAGGLDNFTLDAVYVRNGYQKGRLAPDAEHLGPDGNVTAPSIPEGVAPSPGVGAYISNDPSHIEGYLHEAPNKGLSEDPFCFIVKGYYEGGPETFYKIEFYDRTGNSGGEPANGEGQVKPTAENRFDILRNHVYVVNIVRVSGPGYATVDIAAESEPINIEVTVDVVDELESMEHIATDGQYVLGLSSEVVNISPASEGYTGSVEVFTDYDAPSDGGWVIDTESLSEEVQQLIAEQKLLFLLNGEVMSVWALRGSAGATDVLTVGCSLDGASSVAEIPIPIRAGRMNATLRVRPFGLRKPLRNMLPGQRFLSNGAHELVLDLSNSNFVEAQARVSWHYVNTDYGTEGTDLAVRYFDETGEQGISVSPERPQLTVSVPANGEQNWLRRIVFEYQSEDGTWKSDLSPTIYQEGAPVADAEGVSTGYLVKYTAVPGASDAGTYTENPHGTAELSTADGAGVPWKWASPRQKASFADIARASAAVAQAKATGRAQDPGAGEAPTELRGSGKIDAEALANVVTYEFDCLQGHRHAVSMQDPGCVYAQNNSVAENVSVQALNKSELIRHEVSTYWKVDNEPLEPFANGHACRIEGHTPRSVPIRKATVTPDLYLGACLGFTTETLSSGKKRAVPLPGHLFDGLWENRSVVTGPGLYNGWLLMLYMPVETESTVESVTVAAAAVAGVREPSSEGVSEAQHAEE